MTGSWTDPVPAPVARNAASFCERVKVRMAMGVAKRLPLACALVTAAWLLTGAPVAATSADAAFANIRISNFGKVDDHLYRGAQPSGRDYADLGTLGVKTIVDLRDDPDQQEAALVARAGMTLVRIPMSGWDRPADAAVAQFLTLATSEAAVPLFVHCALGRHRTGVMAAVYRMRQSGWTATQAYTEMQKYHFDNPLAPHTKLKTFVFDYFAQLQHAGVAR
jgi:protein tyrosine/serine phosphatase